ncbi:MAG TPA: DUF2917 domain-containing protein [Burkholderiaceae bacterium]|mgnify:CR=1 FL=1|nr:DUF2917 domain-containing protein [Burkholderiaceae bacterium]
MRNTIPTATTITLDRAQLLVLDGGRGRVRVLDGAAWLTEDGEPEDMVLGVDEGHALHGAHTVIEALGRSKLRIEVAPASAASRLGGWLRALRRDAKEIVAHLQIGPAPSL